MKRTIGTLMVAGNSGVVGSNGFYRTLTLDQPGSDLTDFPVLFSGTFTYLKTIANGGKVNNSSGYDIVFYSDVTLTTKLKFERVYWDATTGECEFRVKVASLTTASALVVYLAYGNTSISTDQQDAAGTWNSNYKGVWHMGSPTVLSLTDSIGVANGTNSGLTAATGEIGGAAYADGSSNADFGNHDDFTTGDMTISMWVKFSGTSGYIFNKGDFAGNGYWIYINNPSVGAYNPWFYVQETGSNWFQIGLGSSTTNDDVWRQFLFTKSGGVFTAFVNNSSTNITTQSSGGSVSTLTNSKSLFLGSYNDGTSKFTGYVDEIKVEDTIRSADWRAAMYSNESDPANFYIIGSETPA